MAAIRTISFDGVIVGGGGAGMRAGQDEVASVRACVREGVRRSA